MIVTIDGPAGSGKTTAARRLSESLGIPYLDTGAMYRAITLAALRAAVDLEDEEALTRLAQQSDFDLDISATGTRVLLDGQEVNEEIRSMRVNEHTPFIASSPGVRAELVRKQRVIAGRFGSLVTEGRDQGTVAFPEADVKFFLLAELNARAERRLAELAAKKRETVSLDAVRDNLSQRDRTDSERAVAPLVQPPNAIVIDTTRLSVEGVIEKMLAHLRKLGLLRTGQPE